MSRQTEQGSRRKHLIPAGLLLAIVLLLATVASEIALPIRNDARHELDDIDQRYARLAGLQRAASALEQASHEAAEQLARLAYPAATGIDRVGADVQQRVRSLAQTHGLEMVGSQILQPRANETVQSIPLVAILDGDLYAMHGFLVELDRTRPLVRVEQVSIQPLQSRPGQAQESLRMQLNLIAVQLQ